MNDEIKELLEEIQDWMLENDYENGPWGHSIYKQIESVLEKDE
jgi:hypothetical protein